MERGYRDADGVESVFSVTVYEAGRAGVKLAVPSEQTAPEVDRKCLELGIVSTFERFTWADYQAGDVVEFDGAPAVIVEADAVREQAKVSTFPGHSYLIGWKHSQLRHVAGELSAVQAARVDEIRAYESAVAL
jgi:hypothetical protein